MRTGKHPVVLCGGRMFMHAVERLPSTAGKPYRALVAKVPDDALITSIAAGDKHAMVLLFMRHNVRIHRFVMRLTGKASIAEDIVSEVFLDIWRGAAEFSGKSNVSTWLLGIARNKTMSTLRRRTEAIFDYDVTADLVDDALTLVERGDLVATLVSQHFAQGRQPRFEVLATSVALVAIVVGPDGRDRKGVMPQLAHDERRGLDHVVDDLELLGPVRARVRRGRTRVPLHFEHAVAHGEIRLEAGFGADGIRHASSEPRASDHRACC